MAKAYAIHPNMVNTWKQTVLEKGHLVFAQDNLVAGYERWITEPERLTNKSVHSDSRQVWATAGGMAVTR